MCLMLYLATGDDLPLHISPDIRVEQLDSSRDVVRGWFSLPHVRYIGSHSGCSCGFPSIQSEVPIDYFDGILPDSDERDKDLRSVTALIELIRPMVHSSGEVQMFPIWDLEEHKSPVGTIEWHIESLDPETFFFHEQFLHRVTR